MFRIVSLTVLLLSSSSFADFRKTCETTISRFSGLANRVHYGSELVSHPTFQTMQDAFVIGPDSTALEMWEKSVTSKKEMGMIEFQDERKQSIGNSRIFSGKKRSIGRNIYLQYLESALQSIRTDEIETLRFRHTHLKQLMNSGSEFSRGDLREFVFIQNFLASDRRFTRLQKIEFEIIYAGPHSRRSQPLRKIFSVSPEPSEPRP